MSEKIKKMRQKVENAYVTFWYYFNYVFFHFAIIALTAIGLTGIFQAYIK